MIRFPEQHFTVACLCNLAGSNPSELTRKVAEIYLAKEMKPAEKAHGDDERAVSGIDSDKTQTSHPPFFRWSHQAT